MKTSSQDKKRKGNWPAIIEAVPPTYSGRGISAAIDEVRRYMSEHDLAWCRSDRLTSEILRTTPHCGRTQSYHPGYIKQPAYYTDGVIAPARVVADATASATALGVRYGEGLIYSTVRPGVRQEWEYSFDRQKWVKERRWKKIAGKWQVPSSRERYYTARSLVVLVGSEPKILTTLRGKSAQISGYYVTREKVAKNVAFLIAKNHPQKFVASQSVLMRAMRRLAPPAMEVVLSPAADGAAPTPAFRERATREEYHVTLTSRRMLADALTAFATRAAAREKTENDALEKSLIARDLLTIRVTLEDSRKAGNCVEGALAFAELKLHLSREEVLAGGYLFSVPAERLLSVANGDRSAVERAVKTAWLRETTVAI